MCVLNLYNVKQDLSVIISYIYLYWSLCNFMFSYKNKCFYFFVLYNVISGYLDGKYGRNIQNKLKENQF